MRVCVWLGVLGLAACADDGPEWEKRAPKGTSTGSTPTGSTSTATGTPTGTGTGTSGTTTEFDCGQVLPGPPFDITSYGILTQEDFDFSLGGYLVYQSGIAVVGTDKQAQITVLSPGAAGDPRGVHGLSDGRIVIMSPWDGEIKIADPNNAGLTVLAGGLDTPNGIDVGTDDTLYFSTYGEVGWTTPDGSDGDLVYSFNGFSGTPNGIVLSPDETRITVAVPAVTDTDFMTLDLLGPNDWGNPQVLHHANGFFTTIDSDVCGNIYTIEYSAGDLYRIYPDGTFELLAHLDSSGAWGYSALRFGPGHSGWERDHLYVSKRNTEVFEIDIGVPGRRHPTSP